MNIGQVAEKAGIPAKTIRYYEDIGLVTPPRHANGYRSFADQDVHRLAFLGRARSLGFSISDCRTLMALYQDEERTSADVKSVAQQHLRRIDEKLLELKALRNALDHLVQSCAGDNRPDCPILSDLATGKKD
ncbi:MAG: Cu(I)-responsive transcriptional regulator [Paracoccaceae bacterium]